MARTKEKGRNRPPCSTKTPTEFGIKAHDIFFWSATNWPISTVSKKTVKTRLKPFRHQTNSRRNARSEYYFGRFNISFGLNPAARVVLNSIFLHECVEVGMNSAIVNASKILPLNRFNEHEIEVALDLIYDRRKFEGDICVYDPLMNSRHCLKEKPQSQWKQDISNLPLRKNWNVASLTAKK